MYNTNIFNKHEIRLEIPMGYVTQILSDIESGDQGAAEKLLPLIYEELRRLAAAKMAGESPDQTLQATALVHVAYLRLVDVEQPFGSAWFGNVRMCR
jgi:hypothetical protein